MSELYLFTLVLNFYLMGLIWVIQGVHYPAFHYVDTKVFKGFAQFHQSAITRVVGLPMILELFLTAILFWNFRFEWRIGVILTLNILIWLSTFFVSVPLHSKLTKGFDKEWVEKLVITNWPRTLAWTLKGILMLLWIKHYVVFK